MSQLSTWTVCLTLALLACATILPTFTQAAVETGTISTNGFAYGGKFCFQTGDPAGTMVATLNVPIVQGSNLTALSDIRLVWYDDESPMNGTNIGPGGWGNLLDNWDNWDCATKVAYSHNYDTGGLKASSIVQSPDGTQLSLTFTPDAYHQETRPRFWYWTFVQCQTGINSADYNIHAVQSGQSSWNQEFGQNEAGLNSLYLAFFLLFTIVIVVNCYGTYQLQQKLSYLHPMIKLFLIVLIIEYLSLFLLLLHYGSYAQNGTGILLLLKIGQVLAIVSRCFFMLLLLLLAKGWTISNETLTHKGAIVGVILTYLVLSIFLLIWTYAAQDPMRTALPNSVAAVTILLDVVWLGFAFWFSVTIFYFSYRKEENPSKKKMYLILGLIYTIWFFLPPLASFAVFALEPWARDRVVAFLTVSITTGAYAVLVFLFWPSRAEEYFSIATPDVMTGGARGGDEDYATL